MNVNVFYLIGVVAVFVAMSAIADLGPIAWDAARRRIRRIRRRRQRRIDDHIFALLQSRPSKGPLS